MWGPKNERGERRRKGKGKERGRRKKKEEIRSTGNENSQVAQWAAAAVNTQGEAGK